MSNIQAAHSPPSQVGMQDQTGASQIPPNRKQHHNQTVCVCVCVWESKNPIENLGKQKSWGCLVHNFKHKFSVFK